LQDTAFPVLIQARNGAAILRFMASQAAKYASAVSPVVELLVPGSTWGSREHEPIWTRTMREIVNADTLEGMRALLSLARFPGLIALYAAGGAALHCGATARCARWHWTRRTDQFMARHRWSALCTHEIFDGANKAAAISATAAIGAMPLFLGPDRLTQRRAANGRWAGGRKREIRRYR
jgi:hypothetical protein